MIPTVVALDRLNAAFGVGSPGFSDGTFCVLPSRSRPESTASERHDPLPRVSPGRARPGGERGRAAPSARRSHL